MAKEMNGSDRALPSTPKGFSVWKWKALNGDVAERRDARSDDDADNGAPYKAQCA